MTKRMLIDSTHAEETRVVVLDGNRLDEFDLETSTKRQLKGNIYLAKVVRVEPSLQAAFVEYGGNRHGFLAFGEIHPDYYQIPVADRKRLIEAQEQEALEHEAEEERRATQAEAGAAEDPASALEPDGAEAEHGAFVDSDTHSPSDESEDEPATADESEALAPAQDAGLAEAGPASDPDHQPVVPLEADALPRPAQVAQPAAIAQEIVVAPEEAAALFPEEDLESVALQAGFDLAPEIADAAPGPEPELTQEGAASAAEEPSSAEASRFETSGEGNPDSPPPEQIGGENDTEEHPTRRATPRFLRNYKIQEVIRRRQIMLVQVVKEERGSKGAALTTYISLAGRFCVLMPNSPRGGGISRKITSATDRKRLKEITSELDLPRGMGLIIRTAGANRPKQEILRDCEYLLNQWDQIRELTMKSIAPALIYEEASLIKRAIRDVYSRDVDEILVDGEQGWRAARDFMRMLMPTHARKVQLWRDAQPLFAKAQVEAQLEAMLLPTVQLRSGGYLVINQTEALVAIDVNSGRSTRERGIEETALRTNLEAADEVARQLRLRDLAGLIVIDFIDMESRRNVGAVERRLKDALKHDRARIQVGSISHFGLLEMSRQRLRPSLTETNFALCAHCGGTGHVRSTESAALHLLRAVEEEGGKRRAAEIVVHCAASVALYILNYKRERLSEVEARHGMLVTFMADDSLLPPALRIERVRAQTASDAPMPVQQIAPPEPAEDLEEIEGEAEEVDEEESGEAAASGETAEERDQRRGRRRRRRRGGRREELASAAAGVDAAEGPAPAEDTESGSAAEAAAADADSELTGGETEGEPGAAEGEEGERRRRGRRGGRRRRRDAAEGDGSSPVEPGDEDLRPEPAPPAAYVGPTPADPFAGTSTFDFFEALEQAEQERSIASRPSADQAPLPMSAPMAPEPAVPEEVPEAAASAPAPAVTEVAEPEREPEPEPAPEPAAPVIAPVLIGADAGPAEKKRGWWRR